MSMYDPESVVELLGAVLHARQEGRAAAIVAQVVTGLIEGTTLPPDEDLIRAADELRELPPGAAICWEWQEHGATVSWDVTPPTSDGLGERSRQNGDITVRMSSRKAQRQVRDWTLEASA